ncbi:MAG: GEVED domain-containing protein [Kiritimatiellia bacterium]
MKTKFSLAACGMGVWVLFAGLSEAGPSLPVPKPPVQSAALLTGPGVDPAATNGQWFMDAGGIETVRTNEFHDEVSGGLGANAITGYVDSIVYQGGPGTPIQGFSIQATIHNDTTLEAGWGPGANSHGESRPRDLSENPYVGPLVDVKLAAEFAIGDTNKLPVGFNYPAGPYREGESPFIEAVNEDQWGWYCWNPEDPDPEHKPSGGYFVPTWDFGTIPQGQSATRQLTFVVVPPGLQPSDPRYLAIVASYTSTNDVLLNRSQSLKISTWIDDLALDLGSPMEEPPPLRLSDVSVFHNPYLEEEEQLDFGDAPDPTYPTLLASDGARHTVVPGVYLGALIDAEADGQPNAGATGDDMANLADEDGVALPPQLYVGLVSTAQVAVSTFGYLTAWIDYNANGSWEGTERIFGAMVVTAGVNNLIFTVPPGTPPGAAYARFRYTTQMGALLPTGAAPDGEVEDCHVTILQEEEEDLDFGDAPDVPYPTLIANDGARHGVVPGVYLGALIDAEADGQPDSTATGDDLANLADEDGVSFLNNWVAGQVATVQVAASTSGIVSAWVDFDANGSWGDFGENVLAGAPVVAGANVMVVNVPASSSTVSTYARFRFTTLPVFMMYTGLVANGEVEDYALVVYQAEEEVLDFGDANDSAGTPGYPTLLANNGARHAVVPGVYLGAAIDAEPDGQPDGTATGDDNNPPLGIDDEDGVALPATLYAGSTVPVPVTASVAGFLNAWIDWNADGDWLDAGEQVFANQPLGAGPNLLPLPVPVPPALSAGSPHTRWRYTTNAVVLPGPTFVGWMDNGEVEDYEVRLESVDFGDAPDPPYPTRLASDGARHRTSTAYWLGATAPDTEPEGLADVQALGDDNDNVDDEDWVAVAATLVRGSNKTITAYASTNGFLNVWVDFNADGDWADGGERAVADCSLTAGSNAVVIAVPADSAVGPTFARARFCSVAGGSYVGLASDGEVEDYAVTIYQNGPDTNHFTITNVAHSAANQTTIWWVGATDAVYETQFILDLPSTASPPWTAWGARVTGPPLTQADTNAGNTAKHYRVVAPYAPPPP